MARFVVRNSEDVSHEELERLGMWRSDDEFDFLYDTEKDEVVYRDSIWSPEDKFLYRDLRVFVDKLNEVADGR